MLQARLFALIILSSVANAAHAGTLSDGQWSASACEAVPEPPALNTAGSVDEYNQSVTKVNDWQQLAQTYMICVANEANTDNLAITKTANEELARLKAAVEKIKADSAAAKFGKNQ